MKRHGNLFSDIVTKENIWFAHQRGKRGKCSYKEVQLIEKNPDYWLNRLRTSLIDGSFSTANYYIFKVYEPKEREIFKLPYFPDRVVHHAILNILKPIWDKLFIYDVYSSIEGKGIHAAINRLQGFLNNSRDTRYCLQFDVSKFYPSVDHNILMQRIIHKIKDSNVLMLLEDIVRSPPGDKGIPIGNYTSQYFANLYLNKFDHWLKHILGIKYYIRYADDGIILSGNKKRLHAIKDAISQYFSSHLKLSLNSKTQVYSVADRGIDFLGYRTFRNYILLRKRSAKKFKRKLRQIKQYHKKMTPQHIISSVMSFLGWIQHCDGYNLLKSYILMDAKLLTILDVASNQLGIKNPVRIKYGVTI